MEIWLQYKYEITLLAKSAYRTLQISFTLFYWCFHVFNSNFKICQFQTPQFVIFPFPCCWTFKDRRLICWSNYASATRETASSCRGQSAMSSGGCVFPMNGWSVDLKYAVSKWCQWCTFSWHTFNIVLLKCEILLSIKCSVCSHLCDYIDSILHLCLDIVTQCPIEMWNCLTTTICSALDLSAGWTIILMWNSCQLNPHHYHWFLFFICASSITGTSSCKK